MRIPEAPRSESHPSHPHPHSKLSSGGSDESRTSSIINPSIHHSHLLKSNSFKSTSSPSHTTSSSYSSPHPSISPFASPRQIPVLDTTKIVKQLVIRARSPSTPQTSGPCHPPSPQAGLDLIMWLKVSIPQEQLPTANRPVTLRLMSDHNLRLCHSNVFPLTRRSTNSKPALQASGNWAQATQTASILNLSKSFRNKAEHLQHFPTVTVSVQNFSISLVVSSPSFHSTKPSSISRASALQSSLVEYAIVLEFLSLWTSVGPDWPNSVIIPTPPCLRNSFRLLLPSQTKSDPSDTSNHSSQSPKTHVMSFPALRRERSTMSSKSLSCLTPSKSVASLLDEEIKSLSDESEPDCSGLSEDEATQTPYSHWSMNESSPRYEGVFQSTQDLCVSILQDDLQGPPSLDAAIAAQSAHSTLSISVHHGKNTQITDFKSLSLRLNLHVTLNGLILRPNQNKIPLVFHLPNPIANRITSSEWGCVTGDGIFESLVPYHETQYETSQRLSEKPVATSLQTTPRTNLFPAISSSASGLDLELLHTSAPFDVQQGDAPASTSWESEDVDVEASFETSYDPPTKPSIIQAQHKHKHLDLDSSQGDIRGRFVVWYDVEYLLRQIASSATQSKQQLSFNLHGQVEIKLTNEDGECGSMLPLPLFSFRTVKQHTCLVDFSGDSTIFPSGIQPKLTLPSGATVLETSDTMVPRIRVDVPNTGPCMSLDHIIAVQLPMPSTSAFSQELSSMLLSTVNGDRATPSHPELPTLSKRSSTGLEHRAFARGTTTHRKRTHLSEDLRLKLRKPIIRAADADGPEQIDDTRGINIISAMMDLLFIPEWPSEDGCPSQLGPLQYLDISIAFSLISTRDRPLVLLFFLTAEQTFIVVDGCIGARRLTAGRQIDVHEHLVDGFEKVPKKRVAVHVNLLDTPSGLLSQNESSVRLVFKIQDMKPGVKTPPGQVNSIPPSSDDPPDNLPGYHCALPSLLDEISILDIRASTSSGTEIRVQKSSLTRLTSSSRSCVRLRRYAVPKETKNILKLQVTKLPSSISQPNSDSGGELESLSWVEQQLERCGLTWRTVAMCWLIYLILSLGVDIHKLHDRIDQLSLSVVKHNNCPSQDLSPVFTPTDLDRSRCQAVLKPLILVPDHVSSAPNPPISQRVMSEESNWPVSGSPTSFDRSQPQTLDNSRLQKTEESPIDTPEDGSIGHSAVFLEKLWLILSRPIWSGLGHLRLIRKRWLG